MKTKIDTISPVKRRITVDLPIERVAAAIEKAYTEVQKKAKLKGFREGHVPRHLIGLHFKADVEEETAHGLITGSLQEALEKEAVTPVSRPSITAAGPFQKDAAFSYSFEFEVHPAVDVKEYEGLTLEKTDRKITDELVDKRIAAIQQSMTQLEPALEDATFGKGFVAFIDFSGTADGEKFKGNSAENFAVDFGAGSMLPAFEEKMAGMKKGESRKVEFDYPKDYFNKEVAGKHAAFDVTVKEVKTKRIPELNDDFAKDLGNFKTMAEVREDIKKRLIEVTEREAKSELINNAMELLIKNHQFEVPESLVISELKGMFESFVAELAKQGKKFEDIGMKVEQFIDKYKPAAENRIRGYYILDAIAKAQNIEVNESDIEAKLNSVATQYNQPLDKVKEYYTKDNLLNGLKNQHLHEKSLDFVVIKAKIKSKKAKK
ncbi:MAG: trigger factor [Deltaproteobacteria bacterium]|nr:trigger factor [Deltaproteobacteria bacterium]